MDDEYLFIATQKPDNKVIKDMLDRIKQSRLITLTYLSIPRETAPKIVSTIARAKRKRE